MMRRRIPCVLAAVLAAASVPRPALADRGEASAAKSGDTITLAVGETRTISARDVRNYSEGSAGIIDIRLTPDATQFVITGRHQGSTTLLLIKADGSQA
ncbi:MAG: pilus assembly protein N-terminal domain-containing protein, partial [Polyangiaceae bacterium]|nr:pilus assembly protein N-terminal domain-containing protein [Polyangiaceae bacterium]